MLERILGSPTKVKILRKITEADRDMWFREIAKATQLSPGTVHPALTELAEMRIVKVRKVGSSMLYSINKNHSLFPEIKKLLEAESANPIKIAKEFARKVPKTGIKTVILFGSVARGEFTEKSDVDMLIIYRGKKENISEGVHAAGEEILKKYDIIISAILLSEKEVEVRLKRLDNFMLKIQNEGKVLFGDEKWLKK